MARSEQKAFAAIDALLDAQRDALLNGRLDVLSGLVPRLERAMGILTPGVPRPQIAALHEKAATNARLLQSARSAVAEVRAMRTKATTTTLSTYDASGRLSSQLSAARTLSRR